MGKEFTQLQNTCRLRSLVLSDNSLTLCYRLIVNAGGIISSLQETYQDCKSDEVERIQAFFCIIAIDVSMNNVPTVTLIEAPPSSSSSSFEAAKVTIVSNDNLSM